jgi:hypothetical protein
MDGRSLEDDLKSRPFYERGADQILPSWAVEKYRQMTMRVMAA